MTIRVVVAVLLLGLAQHTWAFDFGIVTLPGTINGVSTIDNSEDALHIACSYTSKSEK